MYHLSLARIIAMISAKHDAAISANGLLKNEVMPELGLVSVIIPCYNQADFLHQAIKSALAQTYSHREILVVDDGSTENIAELTSSYPRVRYIRQENSGVSAARNTALTHSRGEYLVCLDADDRLLPDALDRWVNYLRDDQDCGFAAGCCRLSVAY